MGNATEVRTHLPACQSVWTFRTRNRESCLKSPKLPALERALFNTAGDRRLPGQRTLDRALAEVDPRSLFWWCETRPRGPLYFLPTREFVDRLAAWLNALAGPGGEVLEVAAGDGFLGRSLRATGLRVTTTDSGAWRRPGARMTAAEARRYGNRVSGLELGPEVVRQTAAAAIAQRRPRVVLAAWLPPGPLFGQLVRAPCTHLIELGADGAVTGQGEWGWRFAHALAADALVGAARCRLDGAGARRSTLTHYFGRLHPDYAEQRPRPGGPDSWLLQFRPEPRIRAGQPRRGARTTGGRGRSGRGGRGRPRA